MKNKLSGMELNYPIRSDRFSYHLSVAEQLADVKSPFQRIQVVNTHAFGKVLLLDGHVQLAEMDEFAYHESLVHIPLSCLDAPRRALVVGGGDGATVRELVKDQRLERIVMVEIDQAVYDVCGMTMPWLQGEAFRDPRVHLEIGDAFEYVKQADQPFDLIVMDATDVYEEEEGELSERLWTDDFYRDLARLLSPTGVLVTQADNLLFCPYSLEDILGTWKPLFANVGSWHAMVPSFGGWSGFAWASAQTVVGPQHPERLPAGCRYLNAASLQAAFAPLPFASGGFVP